MSALRGRPVPTPRTVGLLALGVLPALFAVLSPAFAWAAAALDAAVLALFACDWLLAPRADSLAATRYVEPVLSSGVANRVRWELSSRRPLRGEVRDELPPGPSTSGHRLAFRTDASTPTWLEYSLVPAARGDLHFGALHVRVFGPLGLAMRQGRIAAAQTVKVYPDLTALTREALALARSDDAPSVRTARRPAEGTEFDSLREYRPGDDYRQIDWKTSARRGRSMVRVHRPEQHQSVLLFLDCGRHMAGKLGPRRKLDLAVDAALRLAKVSLDQGDLVGVAAFSTTVQTFLPPKKGPEHLRALTEALYRAEARLEESDYGGAFDLAFARHHRRALAVVFTDLTDPDASAALVRRATALRPRHLPLIASLVDEELERAAWADPEEVPQAYVRQTAARLEDEHRLTVARLRNAGALVVREAASRFGPATVKQYLHVKSRGLL